MFFSGLKKKLPVLIFFLLVGLLAKGQSQQEIHQVASAVGAQVEIVALGDPTHQEGTITTHRTELIKELVQEKDFSVIAIESNLYELYLANKEFQKTGETAVISDALYSLFPSREMDDLFRFVREENLRGNKVSLVGFDPMFSGENDFKTYTSAIENFLKQNSVLTRSEKEDYFLNLKKLMKTDITALFRNNDKVFSAVSKHTKKLLHSFVPGSEEERFFSQALHNILGFTDHEALSVNNPVNRRDLIMAKNLDFLQEIYPEEKIILFGSTTHFLKKPKAVKSSFFQQGRITLGQKLQEKYADQYLFIAYSAISGKRKGLLFNREIELPGSDSIEHLAMKEDLYAINFQHMSNNYPDRSRIMGHRFRQMEIEEVCDLVVFVKHIRPYTRGLEKDGKELHSH